MCGMRYTHVQRSDLNLLTKLQVLIEERRITASAERVFLSQPAMTRILDRLQEMFGDELLIRTRRGYEPTHRALRIYAELDGLLPRLEGLLQVAAFDPSKIIDTFKIAATDYAAIVILPSLVARLAKLAPNIGLEIVPWDDTVFQQLEANTLDLALWGNVAPSALRRQVIFHEKLVCLVRKNHPVGKKALTLKRYASYPHAAVTLTVKTQAFIDQVLREQGLGRKVRLVIPYFSVAKWTLEHSDMILTLPQRLAKRLASVSHTRVLPLPPEVSKLAEFDYLLVWHPRLDIDAAHQWVRRMFAEVAIAD